MGTVSQLMDRMTPVRANPEQIAHDRVLYVLRGRVSNERLAQAQARAGRLVRIGESMDTAVSRATCWALSATDPFPPRPVA